MANKPNIRFKGFTEDWEQRKLGEVSDVRDGTHDSPKYQSIGHPFVTSKNVKNGYITYDDIQYISDEDFVEINKRSKVDVNDILMGMIGTIGNMALIRTEPDFAIKNVALIKDTKQINYLYLYHLLQSPFIEKQLTSGMDGGTQKFVSLGNVRNLNVIYPSDIEQDKIGCYFEKLDHLITLHQRKCDDTKKLKKYMLQKMFPKNGEKKPEIRFAGFTDDWEQRKVTELLKNSSSAMKIGPFGSALKKEYFVEKGIKVYAQENAFTGDFSMGDYYITEDKYKELKSCELYPGDLVISMMGTIGVCAIFPENAEKGIMNSHLLRLQFNNEVIPEYIMYLLRDSALIRKQIERLSVGSIMSGLSSSVVKKLVFPIPKLVEQKRIVEYFSNLDHLITLHQRKCDDLKNLKKYMLQNMFV